MKITIFPDPLPVLPLQHINQPEIHAAVKFIVDIQEGKRLTQTSMELIKDKTNFLLSTMKDSLKVGMVITVKEF